MSQVDFAEFDEAIVFDYLDGLRESGKTNMFGAAPYLCAEFGMTRKESHAWLKRWMRTFGERHPNE